VIFLGTTLFLSATAFSGTYEIMDIQANIFSDDTILIVTGKVKNKSSFPIAGHLIIRMQNKYSGEMGFVETDVNNGLPIKKGEIKIFETSINLQNKPIPSKVKVEFIKSQ